MKKHLIIPILLLFMATPGFAQNFTREIGVRGGLTSGFTYRQYLDDNLSYEGILSFRKAGMQLTMLRQVHEMNPSLDMEFGSNFNFIYGYGAHVGFFYSDNYRSLGSAEYYFNQRRFAPVFGVNAYLGVEYRLDSYPVLIGLDYKPFFEFSIYEFFKMRLWDFAITAKYRF